MDFFPSEKSQNLDPSFKMDIDFRYFLEGGKHHPITEFFGRGKKDMITEEVRYLRFISSYFNVYGYTMIFCHFSTERQLS